MGRNAVPVLVLAGVLILAVGFRAYGIDWDTGHTWTPHPDERAIMMKVAELELPPFRQLGSLLDSDESPLNPRWFAYGSLPLYLLKACQVSISTLLGLEMIDLRPVGRALSILADVVTVAIIYFVGSAMYGRKVGLLAATLLATTVLHIQLSHFFTVDTMLGLFAAITLYFLYSVAKYGRLKDSLLAGIFIGLGLATKISLLPIFLAFFVAHAIFLISALETDLLHNKGLRHLAARVAMGTACGFGVSIVVFVVAQPYVLLDWSRFLTDVGEQSEMVRRIRDYPYTRQYIDTTPYLYHIRQLMTWGVGFPLGIMMWVGLVCASMRGMKWRYGLGYLGLGIFLPALLLVFWSSVMAMVLACALATIALLSTIPLRTQKSRPDLLIMAWIVPYFLVTGAFEVKFLRYMLPITPFLILLGSRMLLYPYDASPRRWLAPKALVAVVLVLVLGSSVVYSVSYMSIYRAPHTSLRTAAWLQHNAPNGSLILKEHWEEGIPGLRGFRVKELPMYEADSPEKVQLVAQLLSEADYIWFYSNRLYGTIPRLADRYPASTEYYRKLFSGELGYELVDVETAYPRFLGVSLEDDTFGRPGLDPVPRHSGPPPAGLAINLGYADESFTVYDHPKGLIFHNVGRYDEDEMTRLILENVSASLLINGYLEVGLMLSPEDLEIQQRGGTWKEIVHAGSWSNRFPALAWLLFIQLASMLVMPFVMLLFGSLPDRGYLFAKMVGLLGVTFVVWLLASVHWVQFSRSSVIMALVILGATSVVIMVRRRAQLLDLTKGKWSLFAAEEMVFLGAFTLFTVVRMANPDLWHPHLGGEKPMDFAYLNAVLRSSYMPPYDPWLSGGYLNYYYWGQLLVAAVVKATGIVPEVAYNLAVALFFALTASGAFSVVYNLAEKNRSYLPTQRRQWTSLLAGLAGIFFVAVAGNLDGAIQIVEGLWRIMFQDLHFWYPRGEFDFWRSSRMMSPGNEITEFPFFTFLFADLHAHMVAMPFTLLALGLALTLLISRQGWNYGQVFRLSALGFVVGALRLINTWDYPTYMILSVLTVYLAEYFRYGGAGLVVLVNSAAKSVLVFGVGYVVFLPYHDSYEMFFAGIAPTTGQTALWQFIAITGLFVFIIGTFYVRHSVGWLLGVFGLSVSSAPFRPPRPVPLNHSRALIPSVRRIPLGGAPTLIVTVVGIGVVITALTVNFAGSTALFLLAFAAAVVIGGLNFMHSPRYDAPQLTFVSLLVFVATGLALGLEFFRVEGDIDRMNSVFKFYLQVWVLLAVASAYLIWHMSRGWSLRFWEQGSRAQIWLSVLAVLIIGVTVYPVLGTQTRLRVRFNALSPTLDGMEYMRSAIYSDRGGEMTLSSDLAGITWLRENVQGSPVILEGVTPIYRWGGRVSVYTGLPSVIGWQWHQEQQRWGYRQEVAVRLRDVRRIYTTHDEQEALELMSKYGVKYIYIGELEKIYYPQEGLEKFDANMSDYLSIVFDSANVTIYRVEHDPL